MKSVLTLLFLAISLWVSAQSVENRLEKIEAKTDELGNRMTKVETRLDEFEKRVDTRFDGVNARFDNVDKQINQLFVTMTTMMGFLITLIVGLFAFILWDRKTASDAIKKEMLEALRKENEVLVQKLENLDKRVSTLETSH